jgi:hypothetical protein
MLTSFLLAILLILFAVGALLMLDVLTNLGANFIRSVLRFTRRSRLLTEYILRAYLRYRKTINKSYLNS